MRDAPVRHFWRNPVVLTLSVVMAMAAATIAFAWRDTLAPGDLVELAEAKKDRDGRLADAQNTTASKWLYAVRDASRTRTLPGTAAIEVPPPVSSTGMPLAAPGRAGRDAPGNGNKGGLPAGRRPGPVGTGSSGGFSGGGGGGVGGAGGFGGVSGTASPSPREPRTVAPSRSRATRDRPEPSARSSGRSGGSNVVAGAGPTVVVATGPVSSPGTEVVSAPRTESVSGRVAATPGPSPSPAPTPEPLSLLLVGTGLAGALGLRKYLA